MFLVLVLRLSVWFNVLADDSVDLSSPISAIHSMISSSIGAQSSVVSAISTVYVLVFMISGVHSWFL